MSSKRDYDTSYGLEKVLSQSIERVRDNIERNHRLRREIVRLRRQRRQIERVPDEVRTWFEEAEAEEESEGE